MPTKDLCVCVHVGDWSLFSELAGYVKRIPAGISYDVYVSAIHTDARIEEQLREVDRTFPGNGIGLRVENRGMDIGAWLVAMGRALGSDYRYMLKIHSKSNVELRRSLIDPFLQSGDRVQKLIRHLDEHPQVGILVPGLTGAEHPLAEFTNAALMREYEQRFGVRSPPGTPVALGSMFMSRFGVWRELFARLHFNTVYFEMPLGRVSDAQAGTRPHAWERLFARLVAAKGYQIKTASECAT